MMTARETALRDAILRTVRSAGSALSIQELEERLRGQKLGLGRAELRATILRLSSSQAIQITPDNKLIANGR